MNSDDPIASLNDELRYAGSPAHGAVSACAGSVARGCAVQFSLVAENGQVCAPRFNAYGGTGLIAACESWCRRVDGLALTALPPARAADWLAQLGLGRDQLAALLVAEDAWRRLLDAIRQAG